MFERTCKSCHTKPSARTAETAEGSSGTSSVTFSNFPYRACDCGKLVKWAFDPGLDFSEQLFFGDTGIPTGKGRWGAVKCRRCDAALDEPEVVTLDSAATLKDFAPITMRMRLRGYRCRSCGLEQAPPREFDLGRGGAPSTDTEKALAAAVRSLGLSF